jgi:hypothetical protein
MAAYLEVYHPDWARAIRDFLYQVDQVQFSLKYNSLRTDTLQETDYLEDELIYRRTEKEWSRALQERLQKLKGELLEEEHREANKLIELTENLMAKFKVG